MKRTFSTLIFSTQEEACEACPPGTFAEHRGATACDACEEGTFAEKAGSTQCKACPSRSFSMQVGCVCDSGMLSLWLEGSLMCLECGPSTQSFRSSGDCQLCTKAPDDNYYAVQACTAHADAVWMNCSQCAPPLQKVRGCTSSKDARCLRACVEGVESMKDGTQCQCVEGYYRPSFGRAKEMYGWSSDFQQELYAFPCETCDPGMYLLPASSMCKACDGPREFTSQKGSTACSLCVEGEFAIPNHTACATQCIENHVLQWLHRDHQWMQYCEPCPAQTMATEDGLQCIVMPTTQWPTLPCLLNNTL